MSRFDVFLTSAKERMPRLPEDAKELSFHGIGFEPSDRLRRCGRALPHLRSLIVRSSELRSLEFLDGFPTLEALTIQCPQLENLEGMGRQKKVKRLYIGGSLSNRGSLAILKDLRSLRELGLEGPQPSKGIELVPALNQLRYLGLYRPRWDVRLIVQFAPRVQHLKILHCGATSLEFFRELPVLEKVEIAYFRKLRGIPPEVRNRIPKWEISHCPNLVEPS